MTRDKILHIIGGAAVAALALVIGLPPMLAFAVGVTAGAAKEAWDAMGNGTPDFLDFVATAAGAAVVLVTG